MDNLRFLLIMAFVMISYMLWEAWQIDYGPKPQQIVSETPTIVEPEEAGLPDIKGSESDTATGQVPATQATTVEQVQPSKPEQKLIRVETDLFSMEIDTKGGTIQNLDLVQYPEEKPNRYYNQMLEFFGLEAENMNSEPIRLFDSSEKKLFLAQSGLIAGKGSLKAPDHHANFESAQDTYQMQIGEDTLVVPLTWINPQGLQVTKRYVFTRGNYDIVVEQEVVNQSQQPWSGRQYSQLLRRPFKKENSNNFIRTYTGGVVYTQEDKYQKIEFDDMAEDDLSVDTVGGWSAMIQHYFAAAWVPPVEQQNHFYTKELKDWRYVIGSYSPASEINSGDSIVFTSHLFAGPKIQPTMEAIAEGLELTVDYSWLTVVAKPIYWLLNKMYSYINNWGGAILCVTLCIKLLFFPLSQASYKSMAKMRKLTPQLKELQDKYKEDKQRLNTEMMAMYRREKVNPLGGCLPMVVQIPVFISLYWVLVETVELRQAEFAGWVLDLSAQDPFYILPVLMGITMKIQQSLNPPPVDPLQAKIMKMFPIIFTVFFLYFPAGLVMYWVWNNSLSILQQWYITRQIEAEGKKSK